MFSNLTPIFCQIFVDILESRTKFLKKTCLWRIVICRSRSILIGVRVFVFTKYFFHLFKVLNALNSIFAFYDFKKKQFKKLNSNLCRIFNIVVPILENIVRKYLKWSIWVSACHEWATLKNTALLPG